MSESIISIIISVIALAVAVVAFFQTKNKKVEAPEQVHEETQTTGN
ncbi:MAG: hypothetical protein ACO1NX_00005 [Chitinophagaceae bacterium]